MLVFYSFFSDNQDSIIPMARRLTIYVSGLLFAIFVTNWQMFVYLRGFQY